jgi:hypothetical protein
MKNEKVINMMMVSTAYWITVRLLNLSRSSLAISAEFGEFFRIGTGQFG